MQVFGLWEETRGAAEEPCRHSTQRGPEPQSNPEPPGCEATLPAAAAPWQQRQTNRWIQGSRAAGVSHEHITNGPKWILNTEHQQVRPGVYYWESAISLLRFIRKCLWETWTKVVFLHFFFFFFDSDSVWKAAGSNEWRSSSRREPLDEGLRATG